MKRKLLIIAAVCLALLSCLAFSFTASAEETEPTVSIEKFNLAFEDNTYIKYAVKFTGIDDEKITENNIGMLYWKDTADGFVPGTEDFSSITTGYTEIAGEKYYVFKYTNMVAKQLADYVYSVAYLEYEGETYYSEPVKFSALEYCYSKLGKTGEASTNADFRNLLTATLEQGAAAQKYFKYNTDRLANAEYYQINLVGGTFADGFSSGLFLSTDEVTITAPETSGDLNFAGWQNSAGEITLENSVDTVRNMTKNEIYTAIYGEVIKYSKGLKFTSNGDGTCRVSGIGTCTDVDIVVPPLSDFGDVVVSIGHEAFKLCQTITSITLPDSVTTIEIRAFYGCRSLTYVVLPEHLEVIRQEAFERCTSITEITIPGSVNAIEQDTFYGNSSLRSVKILDGVSSIGNAAFSGCSSLSEVEIAGSVKKIAENAFYGCSSIEAITISEGCQIIGNSAFYGCTNLKEVQLPQSIEKFGRDVFGACDEIQYNSDGKAYYLGTTSNPYHILIKPISNVTSFSVSNRTRVIADYAFSECTMLKSITLTEGLLHIGHHAFDGLGLTSIVIPDSVISIGDYAFNKCKSLTKIDIGVSVQIIGAYSFRECTSVESIIIPDSVTTIGYGAFNDCANLMYITLGTGIKSMYGDAFFNDSYGTPSGRSVYISDLTKYCQIDVKTHGYSNVSPLTGGNLYVNGVLVNDLVIPSGVSEINLTFAGCRSIKSIIIPDSVTKIASYAFSSLSLRSVKIGDGVEAIGSKIFYDCRYLTSVEIGASLSEITSSSFDGADNLQTIIVDANNEYYQSIDNVLYTKDGKTLVFYPSKKSGTAFEIPNHVNNISTNAFRNSTLSSIVIPDSVTSIDSGAFSNCSKLSSIIIPENVVTMGSYAFYNCTALATVTLPEKLTTIGNYTFYQCTSLTTITIPENVITIGNYAFNGCKALQSVVMFDNIMSIGNYAFNGCTNLTNVYYTGNSEQWASIETGSNNSYLNSATNHYNYIP